MPPTIILTRPERQALEFSEALQAAHGTSLPILISPLMQIVSVTPPEPIGPVNHVIFTSANAVPEARRLGVDPSAVAWCVGDQTSRVAAASGFPVENAGGNSDDLVETIIAARPQGPIVHLHGTHVTGGVASRLTAAGLACSEAVVYDQVACPANAELRTLLDQTSPAIVPLFSARSARLFADSAPMHAPIVAVAISEAVADVAKEIPNADVILANFPDKTAMIAATLLAVAQHCGRKTP